MFVIKLNIFLSNTGNENESEKKIVKILSLNFQFFQTFRGKFRQGWRVVASETSKIVMYAIFANFWWNALLVPICSCTTLKHVKIYPIKLAYQGTNFTLFHAHPHTLQFSLGNFQTLKDQSYPKFTQKLEDFDIA